MLHYDTLLLGLELGQLRQLGLFDLLRMALLQVEHVLRCRQLSGHVTPLNLVRWKDIGAGLRAFGYLVSALAIVEVFHVAVDVVLLG
jgi:sorbitol-specific phosphotransferase system component IIC